MTGYKSADQQSQDPSGSQVKKKKRKLGNTESVYLDIDGEPREAEKKKRLGLYDFPGDKSLNENTENHQSKKKKNRHEDDRNASELLILDEDHERELLSSNRSSKTEERSHTSCNRSSLLEEDILCSEHTDLEGSVRKKKKKKHKKEHEHFKAASLMDDVSELLVNGGGVGFIRQDELVEPQQDSSISILTSPKKHKKSKKNMSAEEASLMGEDTGRTLTDTKLQSPQARHRPENMAASEEYAGVEGSAKKKTKKHRLQDIESLNESVLEENIQQAAWLSRDSEVNVLMSRKKGKKKEKKRPVEEGTESGTDADRTLNQTEIKDEVDSGKFHDLEGSVRKKKKHKKDYEGFEVASPMDDVPELLVNDRGVGFVKQEELVEPQQESSTSILTSPKKHKKSKKKVSTEEASLMEDDAGRTLTHTELQSSQVGHRPENVAASEEYAGVEGSAKKTKKKHRLQDAESRNESVLEQNIQQAAWLSKDSEADVLMSRKEGKKKKEKKRRMEEGTVSETDADRTLNQTGIQDEVDAGKSPKQKKKNKTIEPSTTVKDGVELETGFLGKSKNITDSSIHLGGKSSNEIDLSDEISNSKNVDLELSIGKKKKKKIRPEGSRNAAEDASSEDPYRTSRPNSEHDAKVPKSSKKKTQAVSLEETSVNIQNGTHRESNDSRKSNTTGYQSPSFRSPHEVSASGDDENSDKEGPARRKVKKKHRTKESESQTTTGMNYKPKRIKLENNTTQEVTSDTDDVETLAQTNAPAQGRKQNNQAVGEPEQLSENEERVMGKSRMYHRSPGSKAASEYLLSCLRPRDRALLEEYFPHIRTLAQTCVRDLINSDLERIKIAKLQGIMYRTGRYESAEDELIKKNVQSFLDLTGLETGELLFHSYRFPDRRAAVDRLKKKFQFRLRIAEGLYRSTRSVYDRGQKLFDLSSNKARFTEEEIQQLHKQEQLHGNKWHTIAAIIGRSSRQVQLKASQLRHKVNHGKWSTEEVNKLIQAVKTFVVGHLRESMGGDPIPDSMFIPKENLYRGIPWVQVMEKVRTRNWTHCKSKWNDFLTLRMNNGASPFEGVLGYQNNINIIKWLHDTPVMKHNQVDWDALSNAIGNISPMYIQQKVYRMKSEYIPDWEKRSFKEIVDLLYCELLPILEKKLQRSLKTSKSRFLEIPEKKDKFMIGEIFDEYIGDDIVADMITTEDSEESSNQDDDDDN